jgi:(2Fe-2S) ferredoxin
MKKPSFHILVCNSYRISGDAQGACNKKGAQSMIQYFTENAADRGIDAVVSATGCLNVCSQGPIVVVHPQNLWYGGITTEEQMDDILDAIESGGVATEYLISE